ncbi:hypothetical protein NUG22_25495 [Saccharothrix longispora]|nr:hypothetical protein [Saccharothrix longispora]MDU0292578.1 hypothetical protein [Saccharothrix longispora]
MVLRSDAARSGAASAGQVEQARSKAFATASARLLAPSLAVIRLRCALTVFSEMRGWFPHPPPRGAAGGG